MATPSLWVRVFHAETPALRTVVCEQSDPVGARSVSTWWRVTSRLWNVHGDTKGAELSHLGTYFKTAVTKMPRFGCKDGQTDGKAQPGPTGTVLPRGVTRFCGPGVIPWREDGVFGKAAPGRLAERTCEHGLDVCPAAPPPPGTGSRPPSRAGPGPPSHQAARAQPPTRMRNGKDDVRARTQDSACMQSR